MKTEVDHENRELQPEVAPLERKWARIVSGTNLADREQTWQTIRRDVTFKRDDAIRDSCKMRRE